MATKDGNTTSLVPTLRFPEFIGKSTWKAVPLGTVLTEHKLKSDGKSEVHSVSLTHGVISQVEHMGRSFSAADTSHYSLVRPFDVIYTRSPLAIYRLGIVKQHHGSHNAIVSPLYGVFAPANRYIGEIVQAYFDSPARSIAYLDPLAQKGAKNTIQLSNERFLSGSIVLPLDENEQRKIAACLTSLDALIAARGRKLAAHKKGLMQQLFPRPGESLPRLRFPEFRDAPEWEAKTIGDIFDTATGGTPDRAKKEYWNGGIPWVTTSLVDFNTILSTEETINAEGLENSAAKMFPKGTILMALYGQGKTRGKVAMLGLEATTNQACAAILPSGKVDQRFAFLNLAGRYDEIRALSNAGGQENLSQGLLRELPFSYPTDEAEQQQIAACLGSLDAALAAEAQALAALRTHKKGLMQQLCPSPEGD